MEATPVSAFVRIGDSRPTSAGLYGIKQEGGGNAATNQPKAILIAVVARHHLQAREIAGECAVVRTSAIRRYSPLLNEEIPYYFTSTEPYYSREKPQKGEKDSESISFFFFATHTCNHGNHVVHVITVPQRTPGLARFGAELVHLFLTLSIQIKTES